MTGSADAAVSLMSTLRELAFRPFSALVCGLTGIRGLLDTHEPFKAEGGYYREEAIMLLRRFYLSENQNGTIGISGVHDMADTVQHQIPRRRALAS